MDSEETTKSSLLIALLGDTHLRDTQYATTQRGDDFAAAFLRAITAICEAPTRPDFILHSGDMFDSSRPSPRVIGTLMKADEMLSQYNMRMYCVTGNHDFTNPTWLATLFPSNNRRGITPLDNMVVDHSGFLIVGIPPYSAKRFLDKKDEIQKKADTADILLYHGLVTGVVPFFAGNKKLTLTIDDLPTSPKLKLTALADIHVQGFSPHPANANNMVIYPGTTEMCSTSESTEKSVPMVRLTRDTAVVESYLPLTIRPYVTAKIQTEEELDELMAKLKPIADQHPVVPIEFAREMPHVITRLFGLLDPQRSVIRCQALPSKSATYERTVDGDVDESELTLEYFLKQKFADDLELQELALDLCVRGEDSAASILTDFVNKHLAANDVREF